jgi:hypothetical protein
MRLLTLALAFAPLIVFSVLARLLPHGLIGVAALAAAFAALITALTSRPRWPPKFLSTCSLVVFAVIAIVGSALGQGGKEWLATWGGAGIGLAAGLAILAAIPVVPLTEQFARETTPRAYWSSPTFHKVNRVASAGWGVALCLVGLSRVIAAVIGQNGSRRLPELLLDLVAPVVIIIGAAEFSHSCYRSIQ